MSAPVLYETSDGVALVTLNRPDRLNAWTDEVGRLFAQFLARADSDPDVRTIVLTGAGRAFCAGMDFDDLGARSERTPEERAQAAEHRMAPLRVRKPLIAAMNGPAAGLGLIEALYCDVRFCATDAKLTTAFARLGLPAEQGMSWLLPRLVGQTHALDLMLSGRVFSGSEAAAMGLVNKTIDAAEVLAATLDYAGRIARECSPTAMSIIKQQVRQDADGTLQAALEDSQRLMLAAFERPDQAEGVSAHQAGRTPSFAPLDPLT